MRKRTLRIRLLYTSVLVVSLFAPRVDAQELAKAGIVPIGVSGATLDRWIAEGADLVGVKRAELERWLENLESNSTHQKSSTEYRRPLRIRHELYWDEGELLGKSAVQVATSPAATTLVEIAPWTPPVESTLPETWQLLHRDIDGRAYIVETPGREPRELQSSTEEIMMVWRLRARDGSHGRSFRLELPELPSTVIQLNLPEGLIPEHLVGGEIVPSQADEQGRQIWEYYETGGTVTLDLREETDNNSVGLPWIEGTMEIQVGSNLRSPSPTVSGNPFALWSAAITVDPDPTGGFLRRLMLKLPDSMIVSDVGPKSVVRDYQTLPATDGIGNHLVVRFADPQTGPFQLELAGLATIPRPERWIIPSIEPVDAIWTRGTVLVRLGPSWSLTDCQTQGGTRIPAETLQYSNSIGPSPGQSTDLAFAAHQPTPVAILGLQQAASTLEATVRGTLLVGTDHQDTALVEILLLDQSNELPPVLEVEIGPEWWPQLGTVRLSGVSPVRADVQSDPNRPERSRLSVTLPSISSTLESPVRLTFEAIPRQSSSPSRRDDAVSELDVIQLPQIRPLNTRIVDEEWSARSLGNVTLEPVEASGLAWLDPKNASAFDLSSFPETNRGLTTSQVLSGAEKAPLLSWRWTRADATASVVRLREQQVPRITIQKKVVLAPGKTRVDWTLTVDPSGNTLRRLPIRLTPPGRYNDEIEWSLIEDGRTIPIPGLDSEGLLLPQATAQRFTLQGRVVTELPADFQVPALTVNGYRMSGEVVFLADDATRAELTIDSSYRRRFVSHPRSEPNTVDTEPRRLRILEALVFEGEPVPVQVRSEDLRPIEMSGAILQADLFSLAAPERFTVHRLSLDVVQGTRDHLEIRLPKSSELIQVTNNGARVHPVLQNGTLRIPILDLAPSGAVLASGFESRPRIEVSYRTLATPRFRSIGAERPTFSIPCLSFCWQLATPDDYRLVSPGEGLSPAGRFQGGQEWFLPSWSARTRRQPLGDSEIDRLFEPYRPSEGTETLGTLLARWDAGRLPILVDSSSIAELGLGATSPIPDSTSLEPIAGSTLLRSLGLTLVPFGQSLLLTKVADSESPRSGLGFGALTSRASPLNQAVLDAVTQGSDRWNQVLTVERWRSTCSSDPTIAYELPNSSWHFQRFVGSEWPSDGASVQVQRLWPWFCGGTVCGVLLLLVAVRRSRRGFGWRNFGLTLGALLTGLFLLMGSDPRAVVFGLGPVAGTSLGMALQFLLVFRSRFAAPRVRGGRRGWLMQAGVRSALVLLSIGTIGGAAFSVAPEVSSTILAFYPLDSTETQFPPGTLLIRREVWERLRATRTGAVLTREDPPRNLTKVGAVRAVHSLSWENAGTLLLESQLSLIRTSDDAVDEPVWWSIPIDRPSRLEVMIDGQIVMSKITTDGDWARIPVPGGEHERAVQIRQWVDPLRSGPDALIWAIPINPVANSTVALQSGGAELLGYAEPRVMTQFGESVLLNGKTGPVSPGAVSRLEIQVPLSADPATEKTLPTSDSLSLEGTLTWSPLPAADRLEANLQYSGPSPLAQIRFAIDPETSIRASALPDNTTAQINQFDQGEATSIEVRFEPPIPRGGQFELSLWRPRNTPKTSSSNPRTPPRLEPLNIPEYTGTLKLSIPNSLEGTLESDQGVIRLQRLEDKAHLDRMPGCYDTKPIAFEEVVDFRLSLRPLSDRLQVTPELEMTLEPGRWIWELSARVDNLEGRPIRELLVDLPEGLTLLEANGRNSAGDSSLTFQSINRGGQRLTLRFDGPESGTQWVELSGWLPIETDPMIAGQSTWSSYLPWPGWTRTTEVSGTVRITAPPTAEIEYESRDGTQATLRADPTSAELRELGLIPVEQPGRLGITLTPEVRVKIWSRLEIDGTVANWEAIVRYDVSSGPLERIKLALDPDWASRAQFEINGLESVLSHQTDDRVELRPDRPIWGGAELRIRASRPLASSQRSFEFPTLVPYGPGRLEGLIVSLVDTTGELEIPESTGLEPATDESIGELDEVISFEQDANENRWVYRVVARRSDGWSLIVPSNDSVQQTETDSTVIGLGDLRCRIGTEGTLVCHGRFELDLDHSPFLRLYPPESASPLAASVDGREVTPQIDRKGNWVIPLGPGPVRLVDLLWNDPGVPETPESTTSRREFQLPRPIGSETSLLLTVRTPNQDHLVITGGDAKRGLATNLGEQRAERLAGLILSRLTEDDRSEATLEQIREDVRRLAMRIRTADRSARGAMLLGYVDGGRSSLIRSAIQHLEEHRIKVIQSLRAAGLDSLSDELSRDRDLSAVVIPEPILDPFPVQDLGIPHYFQATLSPEAPLAIIWEPEQVD